MKTFLQWLKEDIAANNIGSGEIAEKPLPLAIISRKGKKNVTKRAKRVGTKRPFGV